MEFRYVSMEFRYVEEGDIWSSLFSFFARND
jgi:hypothetical protein